MGWAVEAVADYVDNIRPRFGCGHPAMWLTERGSRVAPAEINALVAYRDALGLPKPLPRTVFGTRG
jgi:hypothetical protein